MSRDSSSYAPKSPDLSSFYSASNSAADIHTVAPNRTSAAGAYPLQPQASAQTQANLLPQAQIGQGHPALPLEGAYAQSEPHHHHHQHQQQYYNQYHNSYQHQHQQHHPLAQQQQQQPAAAAAYISNNGHTFNSYSPQPIQHQGQYFPQQQAHITQPPAPAPAPPQLDYHLQTPSAPQPYYSAYTDTPSSTSYQPITQPRQFQSPRQDQALLPDQPKTSDTRDIMPPRKAAKAVKEEEIMQSPVRTKFPTARIKRIMQADEEVGKVAQQTPIAVGKALELFMVQLVTKSAEVAKDKNSKRITAHMLKQAIDSTDQWDFLQDIVAKVGEEKEGSKSAAKAKQESESESHDEPEPAEVKKKARGGRKKKAAS
ncbi:Uu.00g002980.m01.CDS01 [Anthostomella pinea]|uniref:NCT transcriptional regulatory complex subunit A n=1 Tax=Anthostomella pinea TaxID=933095 RepID=A0AAI8YIT0_9PEZI|nr:Uu.00g002980.m01.CDS01 [Anthostomella pinea]